MSKQVYKLVKNEDYISIWKNDLEIYKISVNDKSINLQQLYSYMDIKLEDEILYIKETFVKIDVPSSDSDRIYNNTIDFMYPLLFSINKKLTDLRNRNQDSIFD